MSGRVGVRGGSHLRRGRPIRRASARISLVRIAAVGLLGAAIVGAWRAVDAEAFPVRQVIIDGATLTDRATVEATLLGGGPGSVFRYDTSAGAARVEALPAVRRATVRVALPDQIVATVQERAAVLLWSTGEQEGGFLVDADGLLFAKVVSAPAGISVIADRRSAAGALTVGSRLSALDLRAARALASVTPTMLGTAASALRLAVSDADGFEMTTEPAGWTAVFGPYGEVTRGTDIVPLQVQCLASLLAAGPESGIGRVVLSPEGQACGTYAPPRASP